MVLYRMTRVCNMTVSVLDWNQVWLIYLKIYIKLIKPLKLGEFPESEFEVSGRTMTELLEDTMHFSITLYEGLAMTTYFRKSRKTIIHTVQL